MCSSEELPMNLFFTGFGDPPAGIFPIGYANTVPIG
jgi:hypothetical protein